VSQLAEFTSVNGPTVGQPLAQQLAHIYGTPETAATGSLSAVTTPAKKNTFVQVADTVGNYVERGSEVLYTGIVTTAQFTGRGII